MQPQKIVEEEELERIKGLLHREALIRSLGIIDQVAHMLHPSHQGQKKLSECWVSVPTQRLTEQGNKGCTGICWWIRHRRLM